MLSGDLALSVTCACFRGGDQVLWGGGGDEAAGSSPCDQVIPVTHVLCVLRCVNIRV